MITTYVPPKQSIPGQLFDVAFLLALVFAALFLPIWLGIATPSRVEKLPAGVSYTSTTAKDGTVTKHWKNLSWDALKQNPVMVQQWTKLGYTKESAADIITMPFDYTIDVAGVLMTGLVILGYYIFLMFMSGKEYKQVIAEKFD
jgi:hypothetical protein